jgi:Effector-associated domain 1
MANLPGLRTDELGKALREAFDYDGLEMLLKSGLNRRLEDITLAKSFEKVCFDVIARAEAEGWTDKLIAAACAAIPGNLALRAFADRYGLAVESSDSPSYKLPPKALRTRVVGLVLIVILIPLATLLSAISTRSAVPWLIVGVVVVFAAAATAVAHEVRPTAARKASGRLFRALDQRWLACALGLVTASVLTMNAVAAVRYFRPSPVILLVPDNPLTAGLRSGLDEGVRLELSVRDAGSRGPWTIDVYKGEPIWIGSRAGTLVVPAEKRNNYQCFQRFPGEPRVLPGPALELKPGMRLLIELFYIDSGAVPKRYLDPPQADLVVRPVGRERDSVQVEELHGP